MHGKKKRKDTPALVLSASGCFAIENVIEPYSSIIALFSRFDSRSVLTHIDYAASLYYNYHRTVLWSLYVHNSDLRSIFIRIVLSVGEQLAEFIFRRKVVCPTDHGVKRRKIGGAAGCPTAVRTHSGSRQIGSTSKTVLAENCSTNPYIKCPGYRARSREQGQPRL